MCLPVSVCDIADCCELQQGGKDEDETRDQVNINALQVRDFWEGCVRAGNKPLTYKITPRKDLTMLTHASN